MPPLRAPGNLMMLEAEAAHESNRAASKRMHTLVIGSGSVVGANMARFLKLWAGHLIDVTLVEPDFDTGWAAVPLSDGYCEYGFDNFSYDLHRLEVRYGVRIIGACVVGIDPHGRAVSLTDGSRIVYDRLEVAPGAQLGDLQAVAA